MTTQSATAPDPAPPRMTVGVAGWIRANLFKSIFDSFLTVALTVILILAGINVAQWVFTTADWEVITSRMPLYIVGLYPQELYWRPEVALLLVSILLGMSARMWGGIAIGFAIAVCIITILAALASIESGIINSTLFALNTLAAVAGYAAATFIPAVRRPRIFVTTAILVFVVSLILIIGIDGIPGLDPVNTQDIGGLMLNLLLAAFGIICSFPIGIMLALGRRSQLPFVKIFCVGFIEIVRGVPLITLLFMSRHILPLTFPETISVDELYLAAITITLFSSAYMAENVRGGMAAVTTGQTEAARALGLRGWQTTLLITLPQGIRNIIPAIVGQSISLFKDTSLVFIIGMLDLVEMGRVAIQGNIEFVDNGREVYLFIAVVFWIFTFSMSYVSRRIERALGVGRR